MQNSSVHQQISQIREIVDSPRKKFILLQDKSKFMQLCSVIDAIEQTELVINTFSFNSYESTGDFYLGIYGFLQAMYVQTDAIKHLCQVLNIDENITEKYSRLLEIRDVRAATVGHPTLKNRHYIHGEETIEKKGEKKQTNSLKSYNFVSRAFLSKEKITLISYYNDGSMKQKEIEPNELIADQQKFISEILDNVYFRLIKEEQDHKEKFRMEKLQDIFSQIRYFGIEQTTKGVYSNFDTSDIKQWQIDDTNFGMSGVEYINQRINLFIDSVKRRDEGFAESIKEEIEEFVFATGILKDLLSKKLSMMEISRDEQIYMRVLLKYIKFQITEFERYAKQLDEEYSE